MATGEVHPAAILIHEHTIFDSHAIIRFAVFPILVDQRGATVPHKSIRDVLVPDQVDPRHLSLDKRLDKAVLLGAEDCYQSCALFWTRSIGAVSFRWVWEILIAGIAPLHPTVSARDRGWQGTDGPSCELRTRSRGSGISLAFSFSVLKMADRFFSNSYKHLSVFPPKNQALVWKLDRSFVFPRYKSVL